MSKWNAAKGLLSWGKSKVSPTITRVKGKYISKKKKKKKWEDYIDTSNPSYKKHWPPGD